MATETEEIWDLITFGSAKGTDEFVTAGKTNDVNFYIERGAAINVICSTSYLEVEALAELMGYEKYSVTKGTGINFKRRSDDN